MNYIAVVVITLVWRMEPSGRSLQTGESRKRALHLGGIIS